ncbi:hypothetical protein J2T17_003316 [Paenibacillus mucilaginosus]|uniref:hypothetical protein n=1 Tax=Paenibacillus mucilaginosus TaxID=61624 RepID=UPI003D1D2211
MKNENEQIQVGMQVKWTSQTQGVSKEKFGTVYAIVEARKNAFGALPLGLTRAQIKFDTPFAGHKRYIVEIPRGGKSTKSDYYCPRMTDLQLAGADVGKVKQMVVEDEGHFL